MMMMMMVAVVAAPGCFAVAVAVVAVVVAVVQGMHCRVVAREEGEEECSAVVLGPFLAEAEEGAAAG